MSDSNLNQNKQDRIPAEFGVWIFILVDMSIFALYFWVIAYNKANMPEQFVLGQETLNQIFGGINTLVLLISSYFVAIAVHSARSGEHRTFIRYLKLTLICGFIFLTIKILEYEEKISADYNIITNEFYRNYFAFTGFHMMHVIFGIGLLFYLLFAVDSKEAAQKNIIRIEGVGLYWHMVDLLWVVLFSLIYLLP